MRKSAETRENRQSAPCPHLLDVVQVDGRWAQVIMTGKLNNTIKYLDDQSIEHIKWEEFDCKTFSKYPNTTFIYVGDLLREGKISPNEYEKIHWGPEQEEYPFLKKNVEVFGIYTRKK